VTKCLAGIVATMMAAATPWNNAPQVPSTPFPEEGASGPRLAQALPLFDSTSPPDNRTTLSQVQKAIGIQVKLAPEWPGWEGLELVSSTNTYRGESSARGKKGSLRMAISGTINRISQTKSLISYDLEFQLRGETGMTRLSAAGSGLFVYGKPTDIITMAGRRVIFTATPVEQGAEAPR
jgi:hypothetical protein